MYFTNQGGILHYVCIWYLMSLNSFKTTSLFAKHLFASGCWSHCPIAFPYLWRILLFHANSLLAWNCAVTSYSEWLSFPLPSWADFLKFNHPQLSFFYFFILRLEAHISQEMNQTKINEKLHLFVDNVVLLRLEYLKLMINLINTQC